MNIYLHVHQAKYSAGSHKAKQTFFSGYWIHSDEHSNLITWAWRKVLQVTRVWFGFPCYAEDVHKGDALSSDLTKQQFKW